jgi:hypothetical protein
MRFRPDSNRVRAHFLGIYPFRAGFGEVQDPPKLSRFRLRSPEFSSPMTDWLIRG